MCGILMRLILTPNWDRDSIFALTVNRVPCVGLLKVSPDNNNNNTRTFTTFIKIINTHIHHLTFAHSIMPCLIVWFLTVCNGFIWQIKFASLFQVGRKWTRHVNKSHCIIFLRGGTSFQPKFSCKLSTTRSTTAIHINKCATSMRTSARFQTRQCFPRKNDQVEMFPCFFSVYMLW